MPTADDTDQTPSAQLRPGDAWPHIGEPLPAQVTRDRLELLTEEDLAAALNLEPTTIASWRRDGGGPVPTKLGKQVFYQLDDVRDWLTKKSVRANPRTLESLAQAARGELVETTMLPAGAYGGGGAGEL